MPRSTRRCRPSTWSLRREGDPFLDTVLSVWEPVYGALGAQDAEALTALSERYPEFKEAYAQSKSHHILIARSDDLPKEDAFELVAAIAERCRALGHYMYMVTEATNQWGGLRGLGRCAYTSVRSRLSPPFPRATSRSRRRHDEPERSSRTRIAGACST